MSARPDDAPREQVPPARTHRTRFFTRTADQFRTSLVPTVAAALMLIALLAVVHSWNDAATRELTEANPGFQAVIETHSSALESTLALGAVFYIFGLLAVGLVHSRRMMGALFAMHRRIRRLAEGDLVSRVRLRRGDYFHDVAETINEAVSTLRMQAHEDLADVTDLLAILDKSPYAGPLREGLRETLETIRERKRSLLGVPEEATRQAAAGAPVVAFPR